MAQFPFLLPLLVPCCVPSYSPLLTWKPSFDVKRSCPPWSQVARPLSSPFSSPPHSLPIPSPFQIPNISGQLCALLRRHRDPGFSWSGTWSVLKNHFNCSAEELAFRDSLKASDVFNIIQLWCKKCQALTLRSATTRIRQLHIVSLKKRHLQAKYKNAALYKHRPHRRNLKSEILQ